MTDDEEMDEDEAGEIHESEDEDDEFVLTLDENDDGSE